MAKKRTTKKTVDKWKSKIWYKVVAPEEYENKEIGEVPASDPKILLNKIIKVPLFLIGGKPGAASINTKLNFRIVDIKGTTAFTKLIGHEVDQSFIKTLARRRRSVIDHVVDVETKDGNKIRIKGVIITANRITQKPKTALRNIFNEHIHTVVKDLTINELMHAVLFGKFAEQIQQNLKKVVPVRKVQINKTEIKNTIIRIERK
ncbi:hypothetical protein KO317_03950 [Candidatus Micrarchaeota archaeon]|nr:hypothetical protein [Candidatus Micrarchaeota archaeon]